MNSQKDADPILFELLRILDVDVPEDATIRSLPSQVLYEACVKALKTINADVVFNSTLPRNNASKVNVCQQVVKALEDNGFRADVSYSALMYPNEGDSRTILMWLNSNVKIDKMDGGEPQASAKDVLQTTVALELKRQLQRAWVPPFFPGSGASGLMHATPVRTAPLRSAHVEASSKNARELAYIDRFMPYVADQPRKPAQVAPSLLEHHSLGQALGRESMVAGQTGKEKRRRVEQLIAGKMRVALTQESDAYALSKVAGERKNGDVQGLNSRFIRQRNQLDKTSVVASTTAVEGKSADERAKEAREAELEALQAQLKALQLEIGAVNVTLKDLVAAKRQLDGEAATEATRAEELEKQRAEVEMVRRLMQDPEGNKKKLEQITALNASKMVEAASKWEPKRQALLEGYRKEKDAFEQRKRGAQSMLDDMERMRGKAKDLAQQLQEKDQLCRNLMTQWKSLEKASLRSMHTDKILEGLNNVKKQNQDIDRVLRDTRDLKKEIATTTDTLSRSFAIVDELIYSDAKEGDSSAKTAYKLTVALNEKFGELTDSLSATVATKNDILDLERKIEALKIRTDSLDIERVQADLQTLKQENANLAIEVASKK